VIVISCGGVPFSDAPKWALSIWCHLGGRQVVITRAVSMCHQLATTTRPMTQILRRVTSTHYLSYSVNLLMDSLLKSLSIHWIHTHFLLPKIIHSPTSGYKPLHVGRSLTVNNGILNSHTSHFTGCIGMVF
jgi:hypothetical protein